MSVSATYQNILTPQLKRLIPFYVLIIAVMIFYGNAFDNSFLYDDKYLVLKNKYLLGWGSLGDIFRTYVNNGAERTGHFYRPLQNIVYLMLYQSFGPSTLAFHLLNIFLHAANACLLYALGRKLGFNAWAVFLAALLWALHPIQTEAVTYVSATADTLYSFFCLLVLVILAPDFKQKRMWIAAPLFILGLLSKETAIVLPLLVMATIYLVNPKRLTLKPYLPTLPLWAVAAAYLALRMIFLPIGTADLLNVDDVSKLYGTHISIRIYTFLATVPAYLKLLVWPAGLHMDRDFKTLLDPWFREAFAGLAIIAAAIAQIVWGRGKRGLPLSWGLMWFAICHFPQSGIIVPVNSLFLEHWTYLPTAGLFLGIAETTAGVIRKPEAVRGAAFTASIVAVLFGCLTYRQNAVWYDPLTFYHNILDRGETSVRARNNLGIAYMDNGLYDQAMQQFELALKDYNLTPETHQNIAAVLSKRPDGRDHTKQEIDELNSALAINPGFAPAYDGLADIYAYKGNKARADYYRREAEKARARFRVK